MLNRKAVSYGSNFDMAHRRRFLWASEAPRILGIGGGRVQLWQEKRGEAEPPDLSGIEAVQMGHAMQKTILKLFNEQVDGPAFLDAGETWERAVGVDFLAAHTDGITSDENAILEIKNFNQSRRREFGDWGSDQVSPSVYAQCVHEAIAFDAETVYVAVLFGGQEFVAYRLNPSAQERDAYVARAGEFWEAVKTGTPPEPTSSDDVLALFPRDNGEFIKADDRIAGVVANLKVTKERVKALEEEEKRLTEDVKLALGGASAIVGADGKPLVTWKAASESMAFDPKAFQQDHPELYKRYTMVRPGSRRFLVK